MSGERADVRVSVEVGSSPAEAFATLVEELVYALGRRGIEVEAAVGGSVRQDDVEVGRVVAFEEGRRVVVDWQAAPWEDGAASEIELRVEEAGAGSTITVEHRGWGAPLGGPAETIGWFGAQVVAPFMAAATPRGLGDWLTDRRARQPSGADARAYYRDPLYHWPNFRAILEELAIRPDDRLLEVGCGGGALLGEVLAAGCRAAGVDHSPEMVRLAREANAQAVAEGRLEVREASADRLPFADGAFTCAVLTGVLGFLPDPLAALAEVRRVLGPGGRLVALGSDPEWKGTPAAPEPMASRLRFWDDDELEALGRSAGFDSARVVRRPLDDYAREAGVPDEAIPLFEGPGAPLLVARRT